MPARRLATLLVLLVLTATTAGCVSEPTDGRQVSSNGDQSWSNQ